MGDRRTQKATDFSATVRKVGQTKRHRLRFHSLLLCLLVLPFPIFDGSRLSFNSTSAVAQTTQDRKAEADRLLQHGFQQYQTGQYKASIESWKQALASYQDIRDRNREADTLTGLGAAYGSLSQYNQAIIYHEQALVIFRQLKNRNNEAKALSNLGANYVSLSQNDKAIKYYEQALPIFHQVQDSNGEALTLRGLGNAYLGLLKYDKAIKYYEEALPIVRQGEDRNSESAVLLGLGIAYRYQSQYDKAIEYYKQALLIVRQRQDRNGEAAVLIGLGKAYLSLSQYGRAISYYEQVLPFFPLLQDRNSEAESLMELGIAYRSLSQYDKAIEYCEQALLIFRQVKDRNGEALTRINLGNVYLSLSQYEKGIKYYEQALLIFRRVKDRNGEAGALHDLGSAYLSLAQNDKAIKFYNQALPFFHQVKDRNGEALTLEGLGTAYGSLSQYEKAIGYQEQALLIFRQMKNRNSEAETLNNLGLVYDSLAQYGKAKTYYQQALPIFKAVGDRSGEGKSLNNLGLILIKQKQPELAIVLYKQSVNVYESIRGEQKRLPREFQQSYTNSVADTYRGLAELLLSKGSVLEAQQVLELLKVQELREFDNATRARISSTGKVDLDPVEQTIIDKYGSYITFNQKLWECEHQTPVCADYKTLDKLWKANKQEYDSAVAALSADVKRRKIQDEQNVLDPKNELSSNAAKILRDDKPALVYLFVTDQRVWIILATKGEVLRRFEVAVDRKSLSTQVVAFRQLMEACQSKVCTAADTERLKAVSQKLYGWLFPKPLQQELQGRIQHLVFSLDRNLRYIPMSALYDGKQYLIENYAVSTIAAAKFNDIDHFQDGDPSVKVLAAGFSDTFPPDFPRPLTNVLIELNAIVQTPQQQAGVYPGTILLNQSFSLDNLQKDLFGNRILHIATHGEFVPSGRGSSYILSGDKHKIDIHQINDLRGIGDLKLVVLSACQTALGKEGQDGVEINSLGFSFLDKGAKSVLASLWNVSDISTSLLMQQFYQNLAQKTPTTRAEALRQAQLRFLRGDITVADGDRLRARADPKVGATKAGDRTPDFKHPYYWSPFILIGSGF